MRSFLTGAALAPLLLALSLFWGGTSPVGSVARLRERHLILPVQGVMAGDLRDSFAEARGTQVHEAIDIRARRGTPVRAVDDGVVERLLRGPRGGLSVHQRDPTASYRYYYAHLDAYAPGLREGAPLRKGDLVGYVGSTGNAPEDTPHLHFAIFRLEPEDAARDGAVNPYLVFAPGG